MGILDAIRRLTTTQPPPNTSREIAPPARSSDLLARFGVENDRHATVRRAREMYATDPRIQGMLRTLARDATKNGFAITVTDGTRAEEAQTVIDALVTQLKLKRRMDDWIRMAARDGDLFLECGVAADRQIVELTRKPTLQMVRLSDEFDRFADPAQAYAWTDAASAAAGRIGKDAVLFPEFLIIHARWLHDSEQRYGQSEFASALSAWKRVKEGELDIAVGRKTRSGVRYVHKLIGADTAQMAEYKAMNRIALDDPFPAKADFYINFDGGIDVLQGNADLGEIRDVEHHIQTMTAASPVPLELVAYGANLNRDVLQEKKQQYDEGVAATQAWAEDQILEPLIERALLLAGILPENVAYSIGWPTKKVLAPADLQALATAVGQMRRDGWSDEAVWALIEPQLPDDLTMDTLFDGEPEPAVASATITPSPDEAATEDEDATTEATVPAALYAETVGAVHRLIGRLEMAMEPDGGEDGYGH